MLYKEHWIIQFGHISEYLENILEKIFHLKLVPLLFPSMSLNSETQRDFIRSYNICDSLVRMSQRLTGHPLFKTTSNPIPSLSFLSICLLIRVLSSLFTLLRFGSKNPNSILASSQKPHETMPLISLILLYSTPKPTENCAFQFLCFLTP